jgi:hypothetical protein
MSDEVLVKAEGVSKKFCRSLQRSLWYGVAGRGQRNAGLERPWARWIWHGNQSAASSHCAGRTGAAKAMDGRERPPTSTESAWD